VDVDDQVDKAGCSDVFEKLQLCLADNARDWRRCQEEVKAWKECMSRDARASSEAKDSDDEKKGK